MESNPAAYFRSVPKKTETLYFRPITARYFLTSHARREMFVSFIKKSYYAGRK